MLDRLRSLKQRLLRNFVDPMFLPLRRFRLAFSYYHEPLRQMVRWVWQSRETTNFTYYLKPRNEAYLACFVAAVCNKPLSDIEGYFDELRTDNALLKHLESLASLDKAADGEIRFGRRIGWYAFVRALKPRVVVETGVDKGLGTCVLAAALARNADEGIPGRVYATELNPRAGLFFSGRYQRQGEILFGDSITSLAKLTARIDLFINDSDHSVDYEAAEYQTVADKLSEGAVVIGDNAHVTSKLLEFARATDREYLFFREEPEKHWYPGGGIGVAFRRSRANPPFA